MSRPAPPPWRDLAARALLHAGADRFDIAVRCVDRIVKEHGSGVIPQVMLAWIDTAWKYLFPEGIPAGYLDAPMAFWRYGTVGTETVDEVPAHLRWAGRFVFARLADDEEQANALIQSVRDEAEWSAAVTAVLDVCGTNLRLAGADRVNPPTT